METIPDSVVEKIDAMYNRAWTRIMILLAIIGVLVPLFVGFLQYHWAGISEKEVEARLSLSLLAKQNAELEAMKTTQVEDLSNIKAAQEQRVNDIKIQQMVEINAMRVSLHDDILKITKAYQDNFALHDAEYKKLAAAIDTSLAGTEAATFHVQGRAQADKGNVSEALKSFTTAATCYLRAGNDLNLRRVLSCCNDCLRETKVAVEEEDQQRLLALLDNIKNKDKTGAYADLLALVRSSIADHKKKFVTQSSPAAEKPTSK